MRALILITAFLVCFTVPAYARGSHGGGHSSGMRSGGHSMRGMSYSHYGSHSKGHISGGGFHYGMKGGLRNRDRNISPYHVMRSFSRYQKRERGFYRQYLKNVYKADHLKQSKH